MWLKAERWLDDIQKDPSPVYLEMETDTKYSDALHNMGPLIQKQNVQKLINEFRYGSMSL